MSFAPLRYDLPLVKYEGKHNYKYGVYSKEVDLYGVYDGSKLVYHYSKHNDEQQTMNVWYRYQDINESFRFINSYSKIIGFTEINKVSENLDLRIYLGPAEFLPEIQVIIKTLDPVEKLDQGSVPLKVFKWYIEENKGSINGWRDGDHKCNNSYIYSLTPNVGEYSTDQILAVFPDLPYIIVPELRGYIGHLSGHYSVNLGESDEDLVPIIEPLRGWLHLVSWEDSFYLDCEINEDFKLIGPLYRTAFIPTRERPDKFEYPVVIKNRQLQYVRYYHPITGELCSQEQYLSIVKAVSQELRRYLPTDLSNLFGYLRWLNISMVS